MKKYFDLNKRLNHQGHISIGDGTLITNFSKDRLQPYTEAIIKAGLEGKLIISPFAYCNRGELMPGNYSLHSIIQLDLIEFWAVVRDSN